MTGDNRAPGGGRIDRGKPIGFTFDGRKFSGFAGDTLASALLANGVHLVGRSFKYHRPRGFLSMGSDEPNALVGVGAQESRFTPNLRATQVELYEGLDGASARTTGRRSTSTCKRSTACSRRSFPPASTTRPSCSRRAPGKAFMSR